MPTVPSDADQAECNPLLVPADLVVPPLEVGRARPGKWARDTLPDWAGTEIYHGLYLPQDWEPGRRYPVVVEYAGNGGYRDARGDTCAGTIESCCLGYGLSAGVGYIWLVLPFVESVTGTNALKWWGDVEATVAYCRQAVAQVCSQYGGDETAVLLAGFSRGAIGCGHIGLHDDAIAALWAGFIAHSHFDGASAGWEYAGADVASALVRLSRLRGRPVWHSHEGSTARAEQFFEAHGLTEGVTCTPLPFPNHTASWVLHPGPHRDQLRRWAVEALLERQVQFFDSVE